MKKQDFRVQEATQNDPRSPQDGLKTVFFGSFLASFFVSIFGRFLVRFWCHFGGVWGAQLGIFGIDFGLIFACRSKTAPRPPKTAPRPPRTTSRPLKTAPRPHQERPGAFQNTQKQHVIFVLFRPVGNRSPKFADRLPRCLNVFWQFDV